MAGGQVANPRFPPIRAHLARSGLIYGYRVFCFKPAESSLASESESSSLNGLWMGGGIARDILAVVDQKHKASATWGLARARSFLGLLSCWTSPAASAR